MLSPEVLARIDAMVADAPPLSPAQQREIQRIFTPRPQAAAPAA